MSTVLRTGLAVALMAGPLAAQERFIPTERFGRISSPGVLAPTATTTEDQVAAAEAVQEGEKDKGEGRSSHSFLLAPLFVDTRDAYVSNVTGVYRWVGNPRHPVTLRAGYSNVGLEESGDDLDVLAGGAKLQVITRPRFVTSLVANAKNVRNRSTYFAGLVAAGWAAVPKYVALVGNVGVEADKPRAGERTTDLVVGAGIALTPTDDLEIAADYSFENDISGESDYSLTVTQAIGGPLVAASLGRHGVVSLNLIVPLSTRPTNR